MHPGSPLGLRRFQRMLAIVAASSLLAILSISCSAQQPKTAAVPEQSSAESSGSEAENTPPGPARQSRSSAIASANAGERQRLASRSDHTFAVGATVQTKPRERRRITLPDSSVMYVNESTTAKLDATRKLVLTSGEIFVEAADSKEGKNLPFVVQTPSRVITAGKARFDVREDQVGTQVTVIQGQLNVPGVSGPVRAGEQLSAGRDAPQPAPRASALVEWIRELMTAAGTALVPANPYGSGALIAKDALGAEIRFSLRKFHIDVHIEDGFARTTIDQTYFNHESWRAEGTFCFPLPTDASLSRLAMYVDGKLMEGGMAERDHARQVFETILRTQRDPALLEWVDGSTFKMRVFPLEPRQEKRIILSYTQRLPSLYGRMQYRFPAGHSLEVVRDWSFHALVKNGAGFSWTSANHRLSSSMKGTDLVLNAAAQLARLDRDLVVELREPASVADRGKALWEKDAFHFSCADRDGSRYLMVRYRPALSGQPARERRNWVFLVEASGDRNPLLFRTQIQIMRSLLTLTEPEDTFAVLTAGTRVRQLAAKPQAATPENAKSAVAFLEMLQPIGALDLGKALAAAEPFLRAGENSHLVHLGSGLATLGERRAEPLLRRIPRGTRYVGIGVGKRWSPGFMHAAAESTGGYATQIHPDEPISWRAFEVSTALNAPRLHNVRVSIPGESVVFLPFSGSVAAGEEFSAIARIGPTGNPLPRTLSVSAIQDRTPWFFDVPVSNVADLAGYLPRMWAKLEIDRLLSEDAAKNRDQIVELSKAMYVMTPFTSLLVLENEEMYTRFKVDRGRKDHWAMYPCPEKISVVKEPVLARAKREAAASASSPNAEKRSAEQVLQTILVRLPPPVLTRSQHGDEEPKRQEQPVATAWELGDGRYGASDTTEPKPMEPRNPEEIAIPVGGDQAELRDFPDEARADELRFGQARRRGLGLGGGMMGMAGGMMGMGGGFGGIGGLGGLGGLPGLQADELAQAIRIPSMGWHIGSARQQPRHSDLDFDIPPALGMERPLRRSLLLADLRAGLASEKDALSANGEDAAQRTLRLREKLSEPVTLGRGIEKNTPLKDALEFLSDRFDLPFVIDVKAFLAIQVADVEKTPIQLHKLSGVSLGTVLRLLLRQIKGGRDYTGTYVIRRGYVEVTTTFAASNLGGKQPPLELAARVGHSFLYQSPRFSGDDRVFHDLVAYAPGLNTSQSDIRAVLETEAAPDPRSRRGAVDAAARKLIDRARSASWLAITIPAEGSVASFTITFDGSGRYRYERVLPMGLREQVICDGKKLLHLYPEIGLGARRPVSRFHRAEFAGLAPWALPPAEDLARGADVKCLDERTVAIVPHANDGARADGPARSEMRLVFETDGRLSERQFFGKPGKMLGRELYGADGSIKLIGAAGKKLMAQALVQKPAKAPELNPDLKNFLILPMPYRTVEHVRQALQIGNTGPADATVALAAAEFAANGQALGIQLPPKPSIDAGRDFADRLATFQRLYVLWTSRENRSVTAAQCEELLEFIRGCGSPDLAWVLVEAVLQNTVHNVALPGGRGDVQRRTLEAVFDRVKDHPQLGYFARYEQARQLLESGWQKDARRQFVELYKRNLQRGELPPIGPSFRDALRGNWYEKGEWSELMQRAAAYLVAHGRRPEVVTLAEQSQELDDPILAERLIQLALDGAANDPQKADTLRNAIEFYWGSSRHPQADKLVQLLLSDESADRDAQFWRLGAIQAVLVNKPKKLIAYLERALEIEHRQLPAFIDLEAVRQDYGVLLLAYEQLADAYDVLETEPPKELIDRVARAADRWRALDPDGARASRLAARVLLALHADDRAWDYLTTEIAQAGGDAEAWRLVADVLSENGELDLADRAYSEAIEADPKNLQVLWSRACHLESIGKKAEAQALLRKIASSESPQYMEVRQKARDALEGQ